MLRRLKRFLALSWTEGIPKEAFWLWRKALRDFAAPSDPAPGKQTCITWPVPSPTPALCPSRTHFAISHLCLHKDDSRRLVGLSSPTHVVLLHLLRSQAAPGKGQEGGLGSVQALEGPWETPAVSAIPLDHPPTPEPCTPESTHWT